MLRALRTFLAVLFATVAVLGYPALHSSPAGATDVTVLRQSGSDRYATAAAISAGTFGPGVSAAFIAVGSNFPDALAGGPAAAMLRGPLLLTAADYVPGATTTELARLQPGRIVVLGGPGAVRDTVVAALRAHAPVERVFGADRYATAAAVSARYFAPGVATVHVATGVNFPDALSAGAAAARSGGPVLLVGTSSIPPATGLELARLRPATIVVAGGPGVVSDAVLVALRSYSTNVVRSSGADRYGTSAALSGAFPAGTATSYVAAGTNFPDALAAVPAAGATGAPLLLVHPTSLPTSIATAVGRLAPTRIVVVGGPSVVSDGVVTALRGAAGGIKPLPACVVADVPTRYQAYGDHWRTLLDWTYMIPAGYRAPDLVPAGNAGIRYGTYGTVYVRNIVIADLRAMSQAAAAAGHGSLIINSAYRSFETQAQWFENYASSKGYNQALLYSNRAGHSGHQLGTTIDVNVYATSGLNAWMRTNAHRFGFIQSYPAGLTSKHCYGAEDWHFRYFGRPTAAAIKASGLTEREWLWRNYHQ